MKKQENKIEGWEKIAKSFHDTYEEQAPFFGYITRKGTRKFDPNSNNGKLMIEVVKRLTPKLLQQERRKWLKEAEKDLDLIYWRIGHQIKIHRALILKQSEEEIIKFVKTTGDQIRNKCKILELLKEK